MKNFMSVIAIILSIMMAQISHSNEADYYRFSVNFFVGEIVEEGTDKGRLAEKNETDDMPLIVGIGPAEIRKEKTPKTESHSDIVAIHATITEGNQDNLAISIKKYEENGFAYVWPIVIDVGETGKHVFFEATNIEPLNEKLYVYVVVPHLLKGTTKNQLKISIMKTIAFSPKEAVKSIESSYSLYTTDNDSQIISAYIVVSSQKSFLLVKDDIVYGRIAFSAKTGEGINPNKTQIKLLPSLSDSASFADSADQNGNYVLSPSNNGENIRTKGYSSFLIQVPPLHQDGERIPIIEYTSEVFNVPDPDKTYVFPLTDLVTGDLDGSGHVNLYDIACMKKVFGSTCPVLDSGTCAVDAITPKGCNIIDSDVDGKETCAIYSLFPNADLNGDCSINLFDITEIKSNYGI